MHNTEFGFMPPLTCAKRAPSLSRNVRGPSQILLQHSVITFGAPHNNTNIINNNSNNDNSGIPFNGRVEGNRTGEERVVGTEDDRRRRSLENEVNAEKRKLQQVQLELTRTLEKLRQKNKEETKMRRKVAVEQVKLEEEVTRRTLNVDMLFERIQMDWKFMQECNAKLHKLLQKVREERDEAVKNVSEKSNVITLYEKDKQAMNSLRKENGNLQLQIEKLKESKLLLEQTCEQLRGENNKNESCSSHIKLKLESDLMKTQSELQKVKNELTETKNALTATDAVIQQVRLFVQMVCQPNFYVVKDKSLQPVDKNRPEPTGFVLVPLTVLLQGYTLLPPSDRRNLIESYQVHLP